MKTLRMISVLISLLAAGTCVEAQHRVMMNVNYSVNVPIGSFSDYIGNTSFRGWNASITYRLNEKLSIGGTTGFQDFYQKNERALYKDAEGSDISAVVTNSIQTIPLLATVKYDLRPDQRLQPYVGVGVGANFIMHSQYLGQFANDYNKLGFAARPEVGLFMPFRKDGESGLNIAAAFNFLPYKEGDLTNLNNWGISVGAKFPLR
jgi:opacity protein-like surface antigen